MSLTVRGTTILGVRHRGQVAIGGDGQVSFQQQIMKSSARKVRRLFDGTVIAGFSGASADALTLFERLEEGLKEYHGNLFRAAVEMAKSWRTDKYLRRLEAMLLAANKESLLLISGTGDVIEPDDELAAIGSGGPYALAAARALVGYAELDAAAIVRAAIEIAASICVYTNREIIIETL